MVAFREDEPPLGRDLPRAMSDHLVETTSRDDREAHGQ
jgi:hypothetical protein